MSRARVVVVGGGVAGLVAALEIVQAGDVEVTLLDAADRVGGKLRLEEVAGHRIDVGAESVLARRPEALELIARLGLGDDVVHPGTTSAGVYSRGHLQPLPSGTLMGIPGEPEHARGLLTDEEVRRARAERPWPHGPEGRLTADVSVGDYVGTRLGRGVVDRLVEPLLGGVYAGHAARLSLQATLPRAWEAALAGTSLLQAAREAAAASRATMAPVSTTQAPVFAGLATGIGELPGALRDRLEALGATVRTGTIARELHRGTQGWEVVVGSTRDPELLPADAVVLATPARPAGRLLAPHVPVAATLLGGVEYASMAIITLAVEPATVAALPGSGFLVPPVDGRVVKASTFSSAKWPSLAHRIPDVGYLRASIGRAGEEADLQRPDEELVEVARREVGEAVGAPLGRILDAHVQRWGGALPQYGVGHVERVARVREQVAGLAGVEVTGAAYGGVGIPAVIADAQAAAARLLTHLRRRVGAGRE